MTHEIVSVICGGPGPKLTGGHYYRKLLNEKNSVSPCEAYQYAYEDALRIPERIPDVLIYVHDDIEIFDPDWLPKVLLPFESDASVVCVGLGGATSLGRESLYKRPYQINDLARGNYASAQRDWSVHGSHLTSPSRVAVVDAFFMAVRTAFLTGCNGWPVSRLTHHCLDLWLGCEAVRQNKKVIAVPIDCMHYGGGTSIKPIYPAAKWLQGGTTDEDHARPHKWLYDEYRGVLPIKVK